MLCFIQTEFTFAIRHVHLYVSLFLFFLCFWCHSSFHKRDIDIISSCINVLRRIATFCQCQCLTGSVTDTILHTRIVFYFEGQCDWHQHPLRIMVNNLQKSSRNTIMILLNWLILCYIVVISDKELFYHIFCKVVGLLHLSVTLVETIMVATLPISASLCCNVSSFRAEIQIIYRICLSLVDLCVCDGSCARCDLIANSRGFTERTLWYLYQWQMFASFGGSNIKDSLMLSSFCYVFLRGSTPGKKGEQIGISCVMLFLLY